VRLLHDEIVVKAESKQVATFGLCQCNLFFTNMCGVVLLPLSLTSVLSVCLGIVDAELEEGNCAQPKVSLTQVTLYSVSCVQLFLFLCACRPNMSMLNCKTSAFSMDSNNVEQH
jgi:hypothetical protein